ncbi:hypothetical protein RUM43_012431 [Polyplax serrata]|uniref:Biogenesis of lysosome-related organelles complex 1 subunit 5 n=1 Tax=Polyplax serrata TaxID=468196 RepID=A0AAN8NRM0_POLSC
MANVIKDIGEIWTRLFDHRPFINGEIKFFLQEFEEKRGDKEVERLFETLQNLTEIRYTQLDKIKLQGETNLETLKKQVDESTSMLNRILEREGSYKEKFLHAFLEKNAFIYIKVFYRIQIYKQTEN